MKKLLLMPLALAAALAGCGGSGEAGPPVVEIEGDEYAFVLPRSIQGGWTDLRLTNTGEEPHEFALARLEGDRTRADVLAVLSDPSTREKGLPDWVDVRPGIPTLDPGRTAALAQKLDPGRYALICFLSGPSGKPHFLDGMIGILEVAGAGDADPPEADATLALGPKLQTPELEAGERTLELRNDTDEPNAVFLVSYEPGKGSEDLIAWEEGGRKGPAPGRFHGGAIDVLPHSSVYYTYTFEEGVDYAVVDDKNEVERAFRVS